MQGNIKAGTIVELALVQMLNSCLRRQGNKDLLVTHVLIKQDLARVVHKDGSVGMVDPRILMNR